MASPTQTSVPTATAMSKPTATVTPTPTSVSPGSSDPYLGVWQPDPAYPTSDYTLTALKQFEADAGTHVAIVMFWRDWAPTDKGIIDPQLLSAIRSHGSVPLITWNPANWASSDQTPYCLQSIIAGGEDAYLDSQARNLASYGGPVLIRMMHEMNGNWYHQWSPGQSDACGHVVTSSDYVAAWRHIHDRITADGATNVRWVWSPNIWMASSLAVDPAGDYPGDAYVDWTALDGYNTTSSGAWMTWQQLFGYAYALLMQRYPTKPIMIAETASGVETPAQAVMGETKAAWITEAFASAIPAMPGIKAVVVYNQDMSSSECAGAMWPQGCAYPIESSASAQTAFAQAVASSSYNGYWP